MIFNTHIGNAQMTNIGDMHVRSGVEVSVFSDMINTSNGRLTNNGNLYFHRNFTNNGVVNFSNGNTTGTITFNGDVNQRLDGTGTTWLYNLKINNNTTHNPIALAKKIQIYGNVDLIDGVIEELSNGIISFVNNTGYTNISNDSFIDGKVHKIGNEAFTFPIGDENSGTFLYRMASISAPSASGAAFSATYKWENSDTNYSHDQKEGSILNINANEYWIIESVQGTEIVDITLSWNMQTTPANLLSDPKELIIVRWNGNTWVDEGGSVAINNNTITTTPTGYGVFTLARKIDVSNSDDFPNAFSPNGDGINETFVIPGLAKQYPNFTMKIYNRYGSLVYDYKNNGNTNPNWWNGKSQGKLNVGNGDTVPAGTYWYIIDPNDGKQKPIQKWLYLNK